jgi:Protein of unknown function (DUF707)
MPHRAPPDWLADKVWRLTGTREGGPDAQLILLPSGRIGAGWGTGFARWRAAADRLGLLDECGLECATFALPVEPAPVLHGHTVPGGGGCQLLHLRDMPMLRPTRASAEPSASGRQNLVILRAGPESLHPAWLQDCPTGARNWDLCLSTYGARTPETAAEHHAHYPGSKFEGLSRLLTEQSLWCAYEYVWLPDDDLLTDWQAINRMFELCRAYGLALAQPSLAPGSCVNHPITRRAEGGAVLRFTSFVEIMAPIFSQAALRRAAGSFALNASGYGLDHLWPAIIDAPPTAVAILDAVSVLHTRPIGASYDQVRAMQDGWTVEDAFHQVNRYEVRGIITAHPAGYAKRHGIVLPPPVKDAA